MAGTITSAEWLDGPTAALPDDAEQGASLYRRVLVTYAVVVFYTGMTGVLYRVGIMPLYTQALLAALALPLVLTRPGVQMLRSSTLLLWVVFYIMVSALWFVMSTQAPVATFELNRRILAMITVVSMMLVLADHRVHDLARRVILWGVLLEIALLLLELVTSVRLGSTAERGTALHDNPNAAGAALLAGWIMSAGLLNERRRNWLAMAVGLGAFLTFSKAALLMWLAVTAVMLWQGQLRLARVTSSGLKAIFVVAMLVTATGNWPALLDSVKASLDESNAITRLTVLRDWDVATNPGTSDRVEMITRSWKMFGESPLLGHGLGSTFWSDLPSTHNQILLFMVNHGAVGLFMYPLFLIAVVWRAHPSLRLITWPMVTMLILRSFFSHNVFDGRASLLCVALLAAMVAESRTQAHGGWGDAYSGDSGRSARVPRRYPRASA